MDDLEPKHHFEIGKIHEKSPRVAMVDYYSQMPLEVAKQERLPEIYQENLKQKELGYLISPTHACSTKKPYVALIKTAYNQKNRRASIRKMFANMIPESQYEDWDF